MTPDQARVLLVQLDRIATALEAQLALDRAGLATAKELAARTLATAMDEAEQQLKQPKQYRPLSPTWEQVNEKYGG